MTHPPGETREDELTDMLALTRLEAWTRKESMYGISSNSLQADVLTLVAMVRRALGEPRVSPAPQKPVQIGADSMDFVRRGAQLAADLERAGVTSALDDTGLFEAIKAYALANYAWGEAITRLRVTKTGGLNGLASEQRATDTAYAALLAAIESYASRQQESPAPQQTVTPEESCHA